MSLARIAVGLVEALYEINIGYIARCMRNFGLSKLILINPKCSIGDEAWKYAMHGRTVLENTVTVKSLQEVIGGFDLVVGTTGKVTKRLSHVRRWIPPEALAARLSDQKGSVLLLFGREDRGLTNEELKICDLIVSIPANPEYPVLNISHAAAIIFYELYKHMAKSRPVYEMPRREEVDVLLEYFRRLILLLEGEKANTEKAVLMVRRLIGGAPPTAPDVRLILGVIRKAYEKIKERNSL